ncbi:hypothetical protein [Tepidibacillus sp. LV47]|uniref:hypothetical protein n=1 Tax=Tepidibacillus sp. LV47 TaxID=3398228 RepID=UPI003AAC1A37
MRGNKMDNLKNLLREVLKEELQPIHERINQLHEQNSQLQEQINQLKYETNQQFENIKTELKEIMATVQRIEQNQPEDIMAMLQTINNKLDQRDAELQVLNRRVFKLESDVERMARL